MKSIVSKALYSLGGSFKTIGRSIGHLYEIIASKIIKVIGINISVDDTIEAPMKIQLNASALEQFTTTGKNLFDLSSVIGTTQGNVKLTLDGNEGFLFNGTSTEAGRFRVTLGIDIPSGTTVTMYLKAQDNSGNLMLSLRDSNAAQLTNIRNTQSSGINYGTYTATADIHYLEIGQITSGVTYDNYKFSVMVVKGSYNASTIGDYEPYTGGIASPNPQYPQDIHTISGDNTIRVEGQQLFQDTYIGIPSSTNLNAFLKAGTYTLSTCDSNGFGKNVYVRLFDSKTKNIITSDGHMAVSSGGSWINWNFSTSSYSYYGAAAFSTITFTIDDDYYLNIGLLDSDSTRQVMLVKGSTVVRTYKLYSSTDYSVNLGVENLFDNSISTAISNCTKNNDIFTTSALDDWNLFVIGLGKNMSVKSGETFYISYDIKLDSGDIKNLNYFGRLANNDNSGLTDFGELIGTFSISNNYQRAVWKTTASSDFTATRILVQASTVVNNQTFSLKNIQISTELGAYTPYGQTPINYSKISTNENEFIRTNGKNLFNKNTITNNYYYDVSMNYTSTTDIELSDYINVESGINYTISYDKLNTNLTNVRINLFDNNKAIQQQLVNSETTVGRKTYTFTIPNNIEYVRFSITTLSGYMNLDTIQFEKGNATEYEPYGTNEWYIKKNIGKVVLDGTEDWNSINTGMFTLYNFLPSIKSNNVSLSNYFTFNNITSGFYAGLQDGEYGIQPNTNQPNNMHLKNMSISSIADFKTWLSSHNTEIYYIIPTPTYTPITGTLAEQLEAIYNAESKNGQTNISQINTDLPFELEVDIAVEE